MAISTKTILLIGYDSNIGLGVLACLRNQGFEFYLLTHNTKNAVKYSRYIQKTFYYNAEIDSLKEKIISIVNQYDIDFIMPYDELEIREVTILETPENKSQYKITVAKNSINKKDLLFNADGQLVKDNFTF